MKYVKLFESWLNEEEEGDISSFNKERPRDWAVMKTTLDHLYAGGKLNKGVLESILGRAKQFKETFNKFGSVPTEFFYVKDLTLSEQGGSPSIETRDGSEIIMLEISNLGQEIVAPLKDIGIQFGKKFINKNKEERYTLIGTSAAVVGIGSSDRVVIDQFNTYAKTNKACLAFFPESNPGSVTKAIDMNIVVIYKSIPYACTLGQLLLFINKGFTNSSALKEPAEKGLANVFAGESQAKQLAFEKTIGEKKFFAAVRDKDATDPNMKPRDGVYTIGPDGTEYIGQVLFEFDKADLTEEAKKVLSKSGPLRTALQDAEKTIEIVGHADGKGDAAYNDKLSMERAKSVETYLKSLNWWKAVNAKITVKGEGFKQKVVEDKNGTNPLASALNRRVEFIIDGAKPDYTQIKKALGL